MHLASPSIGANAMYHYTDLNGFLSIIQNNSLWLTDARAMNDALEISWFGKLFAKGLERSIEGLHLSLSQKEILDDFINSSLNSNLTPHICCFSKEGDLLSQWRAYADDGFGVSIFFDESAFNKVSLSELPERLVDSTFYSDIIYCQEEQEVASKTLVDRTVNAINKISGNNRKDAYKTLPIREFWDIKANIELQSFFSKNPAFSEEKELRFIKLVELDKLKYKENLRFRVTGGTIASYFELEFSKPSIKRVILGPKCKADDNTIRLFLDANGFEHVEVLKSKASYR